MTSLEAHKIVLEIANECRHLILEKIDALDEKHKWLICGRVYSVLFQSHFHLSVNAAKAICNDDQSKLPLE